MNIILLIIIILLVLALCCRVLVELIKFIYEIAPIVLPILALATYLYYTGELDCGLKEMEAKYADHIKTTKD